SSAGLPKALQLLQDCTAGSIKILHQADYLSNSLCQRWGYSDYHNALKLGYDPLQMAWPAWVETLLPTLALPQVLAPGEIIGPVDKGIAAQYGLSTDCQICAGSTDSNAAFIATSATRPGEAVTSLGSTLVIKSLNQHPIEDLESGVYSHKLGDLWLVGGGSNAGARILREYFSDQQIADYSARMDLQHPTGLQYYPLSVAGERFPYNDPDKLPQLSPRPASDVVFLQGLLEGLSDIEKTGYEKLVSLGASRPARIQTCGGGAQNPQWSAMRSRLLGIPVTAALQTEACYGSALLALQGLRAYHK
ncbi:MAG: carbohydrate kinase, partial [Gammaproteobacteria bacterium]|nr:carbohydrate kinase [Gammaproteobacteria bacterium]